MTARVVPCPQCGEDSLFAPSNRWRPFCSERCRNVDLGVWASDGYRVPDRPQASEDAGTPPGGSDDR